MTIDSSYHLIDIAGETFLVKQGVHGVDMTKIISLNPSALALYTHFKEKDFLVDDASAFLEYTYGISSEKATEDAEEWIKTMTEYGMVKD